MTKSLKKPAVASKASQGAPQRVRIIGGYWRSRIIKVIDQTGLRPTTDRVRETLFNWLGQNLHGLRCLDMFAGSGVLGFEALSRGAKEVIFLESQSAVFSMLEANLKQLGEPPNGSKAQLIKANALSWVQKMTPSEFDIVFIDPPFADPKILADSLSLANGLLKQSTRAVIYVECPSETSDSFILADLQGWEIDRQMVAGSAKASLLRKSESETISHI